jgi:acetyl-CoA carboxylase carboxyltransferase component
MSIIQSRHNSSGKESITNREHNDSLSKDLRKKILENSRGGRPEMVKRHQERGKLLVRDRIEELIDAS